MPSAGGTLSPGSAALPVRRRILDWLYRSPRAALAIVLFPPIGWMGVVYFGSLAVLLVSAFWYLDPKTSAIVQGFSLENFQELLTQPVYRDITMRTLVMAAAVTVTTAVLAFPIAYFMARVASPRTRRLLVVLGAALGEGVLLLQATIRRPAASGSPRRRRGRRRAWLFSIAAGRLRRPPGSLPGSFRPAGAVATAGQRSCAAGR
jgi:hypothetical protein